jgi:hypothetical protein
VYAQEEDSASASRVGLEDDAMPVPPWEWRRKTIREGMGVGSYWSKPLPVVTRSPDAGEGAYGC